MEQEAINKELIEAGLRLDAIPQHIAVIMDGNGRWAKKRGARRIFGHKNAEKAVYETVESCAKIGVKALTLYAFSTENWSRPEDEVTELMHMLASNIKKNLHLFTENNIRLKVIGQLDKLPPSLSEELKKVMEITKHNQQMTLNVALSYSGRWEIVEAAKKIAEKASTGEISKEDVDETLISQLMTTNESPDPDLLIRTSGEFRISNFLLWQIAYTEIHITDTLWPDFRKNNLYEAILDFQKRERRYGKTSEQV